MLLRMECQQCLTVLIVILIGINNSIDAKIIPNSKPLFKSRKLVKNKVTISGSRSFRIAIREMDKILDETSPCKSPTQPKFNVPGRRISEISCLMNIWTVKKQEIMPRKQHECQALWPQEFTGVTGGRKSKPAEFPHMGALGWRTKKVNKWSFMCGSSLINNKFVLTAAHCYYDESGTSHPEIVRFGVNNIADEKNPIQPTVDVKILRFIIHPKYKVYEKAYDIALVELKNRVKFNYFIQPVCILKQEVDKAIITGWGATNKNYLKQTSNEMMAAKVDVLPRKECARKWSAKMNDHWQQFLQSQMCATEMTREADTCSGDSGGPLHGILPLKSLTTPIYNAIGITSFGYECGGHTFPTVYTRIHSFIDWIEQVAWGVKPTKAKSNRESKSINNTPTTLQIDSVQNFTNGFLFKFNSSTQNHWAYIDKTLFA